MTCHVADAGRGGFWRTFVLAPHHGSSGLAPLALLFVVGCQTSRTSFYPIGICWDHSTHERYCEMLDSTLSPEPCWRAETCMKQSDVNPHSIQGGRHVDERGRVSFVNGFDLKGVDRFYWVQAGHANVPRSWVGQGKKLKC